MLSAPKCPNWHDRVGEGVKFSSAKCRCEGGPDGGKCDWCLQKEREEAELLEAEEALRE